MVYDLETYDHVNYIHGLPTLFSLYRPLHVECTISWRWSWCQHCVVRCAAPFSSMLSCNEIELDMVTTLICMSTFHQSTLSLDETTSQVMQYLPSAALRLAFRVRELLTHCESFIYKSIESPVVRILAPNFLNPSRVSFLTLLLPRFHFPAMFTLHAAHLDLRFSESDCIYLPNLLLSANYHQATSLHVFLDTVH